MILTYSATNLSRKSSYSTTDLTELRTAVIVNICKYKYMNNANYLLNTATMNHIKNLVYLYIIMKWRTQYLYYNYHYTLQEKFWYLKGDYGLPKRDTLIVYTDLVALGIRAGRAICASLSRRPRSFLKSIRRRFNDILVFVSMTPFLMDDMYASSASRSAASAATASVIMEIVRAGDS